MAIYRSFAEAAMMLDMIDELRAPEGAVIHIMCDNPDFNGQPACAIEIVDDWTNWKHRRFAGDSVFDCIVAALKAKRDASTRTPP